MNEKKTIAILYSGGTDSVCASAIMAETFEIVHLLTFYRLGFFEINNSDKNVGRLNSVLSPTVFIHKKINIERLARHLTHDKFMRDILKYGFFTLSNCLVCGLINHLGALVYCLNNKITNIADGSTRDWSFFPSHMEKVIGEIKTMYSRFGIIYHTPVYDFSPAVPVSFMDKIYNSDNKKAATNMNTTGEYLHRIGIFDSPDLKGTAFDHQMQPRCFQFILHHIFIFWYFMFRHNYADFERVTLKFTWQKISDFSAMIEKNPEKIKKLLGKEIN